MTKTPFNQPLLEEAVAWARRSVDLGEQPVKHDGDEVGFLRWVQENWLTVLDEDDEWTPVHYLSTPEQEELVECGTGCCIAGYLAVRVIGTDDTTPKGLANLWTHVTEEYEGWVNFGVQVLGITREDADTLFDGGNTIGQIEEKAADIIRRYTSHA